MGMEPACTKTCPTNALLFTDKGKLKALKASASERGLAVYDGGTLDTNVVYLLEDKAIQYGLPANPAIPVPTFLWRTVMKPVGIIAFVAGVVGLLAHYVTVGPKLPDNEDGTPPSSSSSAQGGEY
jgi:formate dehydrogenase iron-sulfur subunit